MTPKTYQLLERCVEDGIDTGIQRAHKHTDVPSLEAIKEAVLRAVMYEINEWFEFGGEGDDPGNLDRI